MVLRTATLEDVPELGRLIESSARELGRLDYTIEQIEAALGTVWGVDSQLIRDQTYFAVDENQRIIGCGGWSRRKALFGADALTRGEAELLDVSRDAARIRAFFVHPEYVRRGIGARLLERCEAEASAAGFGATELVATLGGERLYTRFGYQSLGAREYPLGRGKTITFVPMRKEPLVDGPL